MCRICPLCNVEIQDLDYFLFGFENLKESQNNLFNSIPGFNTTRKVYPMLDSILIQKPFLTFKFKISNLNAKMSNEVYLENISQSTLRCTKPRRK